MESVSSRENGVTRAWRKLCNEELHNLYSLPGIVGMIQLRRRNNFINRLLVLDNYYGFYFSQLVLILHLSDGRRKWGYSGTGLQH